MKKDKLRNTLRSAASGVTESAQSAAKVFVDAARATPDVVAETAQKVADTTRAVRGHVSDAVDSAKATMRDGVAYVDNRVQAARTSTGNALNVSAEFLGMATMVAGETALLSAGLLPILFFYKLPIEAGGRVTETIDSIAKFVRGDRVQFIGINIDKDARAVIYDPHANGEDSNGYIELSVEDIMRHLGNMDETNPERKKQYNDALTAARETRQQYGLPVKSPDTGLGHIGGIAEILALAFLHP